MGFMECKTAEFTVQWSSPTDSNTGATSGDLYSSAATVCTNTNTCPFAGFQEMEGTLYFLNYKMLCWHKFTSNS